MKKIVVCLTLLFILTATSSAQYQEGKFSLAGNINYGTEIESIGFGVRAQYGFMGRLRGAFEYKYYVDRHNTSAFGVTGDAHYVFGIADAVSLYPIGGISISRWTTDYNRSGLGDLIDEKKSTSNRLGVNIGLGTQITVGPKTYLQIEAKEALIKDFTQFVISIGLMYQF